MTEPTSLKPPNLLHFLSMEEHQLLVSLMTMKGAGTFGAIARIEGLYAAPMSERTAKPDDFVVFQSLTLTHYHFLISMASLMRCHLSEAFAASRAAIDAALNAAIITNDRGAQVAYAKREKPFDNLARYLGNLIKDGKDLPHPTMKRLIEQQKKISTFAVHADVGSFVHRMRKSEDTGQTLMGFEYFQFARDDDEQKLHTLGLVHTFVMVLDIFADFLVSEQKAVGAEWKTALHTFGGKIEADALVLRQRVKNTMESKDRGA
jgi:hypothetical protein